MSIFSALEDRVDEVKAIRAVLHNELYPRLEDARKKGIISDIINALDEVDNRLEDLAHELAADAQYMRDCDRGRL
jgi:hypothetical protein